MLVFVKFAIELLAKTMTIKTSWVGCNTDIFVPI